MKEQTFLPIVAAVSLLVAAATLLFWGWNPAGAHAAARYTARISLVWFALALSAPGLRRYWEAFSPVSLTLAFLTAQTIHFTAVTVVLVGFDWQRAAGAPLRSALFIGVGAGLITLFGWASLGQPSAAKKVTLPIAGTLIFLIFFAAVVRHSGPVRLLALPLIVALPLRFVAANHPTDSGQLRSA
jgi:hypothetical protein